VKGLVFYDSSLRKLHVNCVNECGDTPLHMAAKWGYGEYAFLFFFCIQWLIV
jgi:hypothetical protein